MFGVLHFLNMSVVPMFWSLTSTSNNRNNLVTFFSRLANINLNQIFFRAVKALNKLAISYFFFSFSKDIKGTLIVAF